MALPPSFSFAHPRQLVLFFRARLLIFSPETRLRGPDTDELLSLLGGTLFSKIFHRVWSPRSSHRGDDSFIATPTAARQTISHISSCRALVVVRTLGVAEKIILNGSKSLRREHAAQLDTCPADTKRSCMYEFPLSNSGESNAMLENSTFAPPKPHFRTTARRTEHQKSAR